MRFILLKNYYQTLRRETCSEIHIQVKLKHLENVSTNKHIDRTHKVTLKIIVYK